jgi:hypothetical protein
MKEKVEYKALAEEVEKALNISVILDINLRYLAVSRGACKELNLKADDFIGRSFLDLFPHLIASANHRNILKALGGETIVAFVSNSGGSQFKVSFCPVYDEGQLIGAHIDAAAV